VRETGPAAERVSASSSGSTRKRILLEVAEGRGAGAILEGGFLERCVESGVDVHVLTPGARFAPFVKRYERTGVRFSYLPVDKFTKYGKWAALEYRIGDELVRRGKGRLRAHLWKYAGERLSARRAGEFGELIRKERPDAFVSTNIAMGYDAGMVATARREGIPTLGNVFSWDHPFRRHFSRPDFLTCWSDWMKKGLVELQGYSEDQIEVVGAPAFDPYIRPECVWTREQLCRAVGLDPGRPILMFASLGQMRPNLDETGSFRVLMAAVDAGRIEGDPQVVLRLHPLSVDYYFEEFLRRPDVFVSRYVGYCPGMRWWPSFEEVAMAGNLFRHADVCVSPGSTVTIETAIFGVPTIIPTFNPFTRDEHSAFFRSHWLGRHFRFIVEEGLLPLVDSEDELVDAVNRALREREWTARGQEAIRRRVLGPLDGDSTARLARAAVRVAFGQAKPGGRAEC
jgi:hypothetical protein